MKKIRYSFTISIFFLLLAPSSSPGQNGIWSPDDLPNPVGKMRFSTCVFEGKVYVFGGYIRHDSDKNALGFWDYGSSSIEVFDPITKTWDISKLMPEPRAHTSVELLGNKMYIIGGTSGRPDILRYSSIEVYDPISDTWDENLIEMSSRRFACGTCTAYGKIYVIGGFDDNEVAVSSLEVYDTQKKIWERKAPMPTARGDLTVTYLNGKIYAFGGYTDLYGKNYPINYFEIYDVASNTWSTGSDLLVEGLYKHVALVYNGMIYIAGGVVHYNNVIYNTQLMAFDPISKSIFKICEMPFGATDLSMHLFNDEILFLGVAGNETTHKDTSKYGNFIWTYQAVENPIATFNSVVSNSYASLTDSLYLRTSFINHKNLTIEARIDLINSTGHLEKSIQLFDDGLHEDFLRGDGVYGNWIKDLPRDEIYSIDVITIDNHGKVYFKSKGIAGPITTIGPLQIESSSTIEQVQEQLALSDTAFISLEIKNLGTLATAEDISVEIFCKNPSVRVINGYLEYGNILPGTVNNTLSEGKIVVISKNRLAEPIEMQISIQSKGNSFWHDILKIE